MTSPSEDTESDVLGSVQRQHASAVSGLQKLARGDLRAGRCASAHDGLAVLTALNPMDPGTLALQLQVARETGQTERCEALEEIIQCLQ